jgi:Icc-related predicted phosphoesterase
MKIVALSDTHGKHNQVHLPSGDMIIHAGDISMRGLKVEIEAFLEWYSSLNYTYKIFIAGNHDFYFENQDADAINALVPKNITYLNDSFTVVEGIKIWGSPITPWFYDWAFNRHRGPDINRHWSLMPHDADIVITHGPVYGILDKTKAGYLVGCEDLHIKINEVKPRYHVCGHIHEAYGTVQKQETMYINASVLNVDYEVVNKAIEIEI